jgi:hypothetical protein
MKFERITGFAGLTGLENRQARAYRLILGPLRLLLYIL